MSNHTTPKAPELDSQIEAATRRSCLPLSQVFAELTHGQEMLKVDSIKCEERTTQGDFAIDQRRSDDEISVMRVMQFAHYLQYESPRFMDAWLRLAKKANEGELLKARYELEMANRVNPVLCYEIKEYEPDSPKFNKAAYLIMGQDNKTGEAARILFRNARDGDEFKAGLIELMETLQATGQEVDSDELPAAEV